MFILLAFFVRSPVWKKRCRLFAIGWFVFFTNPFIIHQLSLQWQAPPNKLATDRVYEAGIVLGGFVQFNASENQGYFSAASDRFLQAVRLYKLGRIRKIVVSGGSGKLFQQQYRDADFARQQLLDFGIPTTDVLTENASRNTFENALFSKKLLDSLHIKGPFLLITSAMHMKRSLAVFEKADLPIEPYPAHFTAMDFPMGIAGAIIPSLSAMTDWENLLKEWIGLQVYRVTDKA